MRFTTKSADRRVAYFISPHGYGHAARASAVMAATQELDPSVRFEIFTRVPRWFFEDSLDGRFGYHSLLTDIGLVQKTPLVEDLTETLKRLDAFLPFDASLIKDLAARLNRLKCQMVICDIAPMGIAVSTEAGIPSLLIENFTWDWIYQEYALENGGLRPHINYLQAVFEAADYRVQTKPVCLPRQAHLTTLPISRKARTAPEQIRRQLGIPGKANVVMITMGGVPWQVTNLEQLANLTDVYVVIPGTDESIQASPTAQAATDRLVLLPRRSGYFHPDLVNASDAVIGKAGYSTVAELYYAGTPFGYIKRPKFRESQILAAFIEQQMSGRAIPETQFENGDWLSSVAALLELPRIHRPESRGADQVAHFICQLLDCEN
jgi:hypothetical protein